MQRIDRTGETMTAKCGIEMTVTEYRNATDMTVTFADGNVADHIEWKHFKKGTVQHPNFNRNGSPKHIVAKGDSAVMKNGFTATVTDILPSGNKIIITFEDGTTTQTNTTEFVRKTVAYPLVAAHTEIATKLRSERGKHAARGRNMKKIGWKSTDEFGRTITITEYEDRNNITVAYDDGTTVRSTLDAFKNSRIRRPDDPEKRPVKARHIGRVFTNAKGDTATVADYLPNGMFLLRFSNGTEKEIARLDNYIHGSFLVPGEKRIDENRKKYEGQEKISSIAGGMKMRVSKYLPGGHLEITFENGVKTSTTVRTWEKGNIPLPGTNHQTAKARRQYLGLQNKTKEGHVYTVIKYDNSDDITVMFEDGTTKSGLTTTKIKTGAFLKPKPMVGRGKYFSNGLYYEIIRYQNARDIDILCEDGTVFEHTRYSKFCDGAIRHPRFNAFSRHNDMPMHGFSVSGLAYCDKTGRGNYFCQCLTCKRKDIMDTDEMKNHKESHKKGKKNAIEHTA